MPKGTTQALRKNSLRAAHAERAVRADLDAQSACVHRIDGSARWTYIQGAQTLQRGAARARLRHARQGQRRARSRRGAARTASAGSPSSRSSVGEILRCARQRRHRRRLAIQPAKVTPRASMAETRQLRVVQAAEPQAHDQQDRNATAPRRGRPWFAVSLIGASQPPAPSTTTQSATAPPGVEQPPDPAVSTLIPASFAAICGETRRFEAIGIDLLVVAAHVAASRQRQRVRVAQALRGAHRRRRRPAS